MPRTNGKQLDDGASETSPLLAKDGVKHNGTANGVPSQNGTADGLIQPVNGPVGAAVPSKPADGEVADGESAERQEDETPKQGEGLPDVRARLKYILPALAIGIFLSAADQTIIVSSYGRIGSELHALNMTSWIATAYFLTLTSFQPLYGKLSDIFGRKACLLFGYTIFGLGCLACGLAQDMKQLIAARAFAGIGGGGMTTVVSILLSDVVPLRERGKWQGYVNIIYATGASTGAPLGGILSDYIGWRWAFLVQAPLCLAAFIAVSLVLKLPHQETEHWKQRLRRIDFLGAAILICAVFALLLGLDRGSNVSWRALITLIPLALALPLFAAFITVEIKVATEPFAPGHIVFHRSLFACYLCNFFAFAGWLSALFYIPLYFQAVDGLSATAASVRLIPGIICAVCGSLFAGLYMQKTGKYFYLTAFAYAGLTLGLALIFLCSGIATSSLPGMITGMCFAGFGNGIGVTSTLIGLIANADPADQAVATACSYLFRSLGSVFGISLSATVANSVLRQKLASELPKLGLGVDEALDIADRVRQSLAVLGELGGDVKDVVVGCYKSGTGAAFGLQIGFVVGAAGSAWFIREKALSR